MADAARARRLAKRIAAIVASAIEYEIKDPGLAGVTITDAKVTADLHDATVYYTVMGRTLHDEPNCAGAATGVRFTPTLTFTLDTISDSVHRMDELLARARAADADLARVRVGAKPAGEADPYRDNGSVAQSPAPGGLGIRTSDGPEAVEAPLTCGGDTGDDDRPKE